MKPANLLVMLSDRHNKRVLGCYGHPLIQTPNLDKLAARGTRFTSAYTPCPICVPALAAFATGRPVHQIRFWDNAIAYDGSVPSWATAPWRRGIARCPSANCITRNRTPGATVSTRK